MTLEDYPVGIERARLALGPAGARLRAVREEQIAIRDRLKLQVAAERDERGKRRYAVEGQLRAAVALALAEDPRFAALRAEEEALDYVREQCQARLSRLNNEFNALLSGKGAAVQGGAN